MGCTFSSSEKENKRSTQPPSQYPSTHPTNNKGKDISRDDSGVSSSMQPSSSHNDNRSSSPHTDSFHHDSESTSPYSSSHHQSSTQHNNNNNNHTSSINPEEIYYSESELSEEPIPWQPQYWTPDRIGRWVEDTEYNDGMRFNEIKKHVLHHKLTLPPPIQRNRSSRRPSTSNRLSTPPGAIVQQQYQHQPADNHDHPP
eukprot:TRINITY_DN8956_c0_g1_i1.p1 TRINITY_DN8956_c0_g1~~TRINITY_DN8956_c0_g1_i1.p1  ORF type:complete len:199 (+),score=52.74 TRINITY_DN8956_c0_g1_i1:153-749(+)